MTTSPARPPIHWGSTLFLTATPLIALVGIPWYIIQNGISWIEIATFFLLWYAIGISITAGYHRLYSHRSYNASAPVRLLFLIFGAAAIQTSVLDWSYKHRIHHGHVDEDADPYNIQRGFWWAHIGWVMFSEKLVKDESRVKDLLQDPLVVWQHKYYYIILTFVALGIPLTVGVLTGHILGCLLIGFVGRIVMTHHVTFFINSLCHMIGRRPYSLGHSARDSALMAVLAFGEGYHNYHHTFPFDYRNGIRSWHIDPAKWLIAVLSKMRLATQLRRAPTVAIMKAKFQVEFEQLTHRLELVSEDMRQRYAEQIHESYEYLQRSLREYFEHFHTNKYSAGPDSTMEEVRRSIRLAFEAAQKRWREIVSMVDSVPRPA